MKVFTLISLVFLSSLINGCASTNQKSLLEERAGYGFTAPPMNVSGQGGVKYVPTRVPEQEGRLPMRIRTNPCWRRGPPLAQL